ncbi:Protein kinase domain [Dillenia turbinata]|uniref:Protein kinase domain n=1 Tax=Dillenia turbinata TaxID=194707 RepID=A0AAN8ULN9_9MAGN
MAAIDRTERIRKRPRLAWDVAPAGQEGVVGGSGGHASPPRRDDDREGHYVFNLGENLTPRYKILSKMGEGTFGRVLECWDRQTREFVAIKVVRSIRKYRDAAMIEVDVLQHLVKNDTGRLRCVQIRNWFDYRNHICIVFEKLGPSLFDFLRRNKYCPFPVDLVREFGRQLLESVAYMHDLHLIHTDLKPENILLVSSDYVKLPGCKRYSSDEMHFRCLPKSSAIKLIDFGSTAFDNQNHSSIVSTRHYRAPEGEALFQTHENLEHLAMMERVLGPLPEHMIRRAKESIRAVRKLDRLKDLVSRHVDSSRSSLIDLLYGLLKLDPSERLTPQQALDHPFFKNPT